MRLSIGLFLMSKAIGRTWLDKELVSQKFPISRDGFGDEVTRAKEERLVFLRSQKLLGASTVLNNEVLDRLESRRL